MSVKKFFEYNYNGTQVRTVVVDGDVWFVAKDVCLVLDIRNSRDALSRLTEDEKGVGSTDTFGGGQEKAIVNESGLYSLVFSSRKADAQSFRKWVTSTVLPEIRKTGAFLPKKMSAAELMFEQAKIILEHDRKINEHSEEIQDIKGRVETLEGGKVSKDYYTVKRFACKYGFLLNKSNAIKIGRKASAACRSKKIRIEKQTDENFEVVNAYPEYILEDVFTVVGVERRKKAG